MNLKQKHRKRYQICDYQRCRGSEEREGWRWSKTTNFQLLNIKYVSHGNIMFSIVTLTILIVNLKVAKRS